MSKDKKYNSLINCQRWREMAFRIKTERLWTCEKCGLTTTRLAVHHVIPIESGRTPEEMKALAYALPPYTERTQLQCLCYQCHKAEHQRMESTTKAGHLKAEADRVARIHHDINALKYEDIQGLGDF